MCTRGFLSQLDTQGERGEGGEEVGHGEVPTPPLTLFLALLRL